MNTVCTVILVMVAGLSVGAGFALMFGGMLRSRSERVIEICVRENIPPERCKAVGDAIYGH